MKVLLSPIPFGWPQSTTSPDCLELRAQVEADMAIIEAGFTGLSGALHLSRLDRRVSVPEGAPWVGEPLGATVAKLI